MKTSFKHTLAAMSRLIMMVCFLGVSLTAAAYTGFGTKAAPYVLESTDEVAIEEFKTNICFMYKATEDGVLYMNLDSQNSLWGSPDNKYDNDKNTGLLDSERDGVRKNCYLKVTAGNVYYFYMGWAMASDVMKVTFAPTGSVAVTLSEVSPAAGEVFPVTGEGWFSATFNKSVSAKSLYVVSGSFKQKLSFTPYQRTVSSQIKNDIYALMANGTLKPGEKFTLRFEGVYDMTDKTNLYNGDGVLNVEYIVAPMPALLTGISKKEGSDFYSYYRSGDENGIITLTFSQDMMTGEGNNRVCAVISYGDLDKSIEGDFYREEVYGEAKGNTVSFNFQQKQRRSADMVASGTDYKVLNISFSRLRSADGNYIYTESNSNFGAVGVNYNLVTLQREVYGEFTLNKKYFNDASTYEVWVYNGHDINFDGLKFDYVEEGEAKSTTIPYADLSISDDPEEECAILINGTLPSIHPDANSQITLSLTNIECVDGLPKSLEDTFYASVEATGINEAAGNAADPTVVVYRLDGVKVAEGKLSEVKATLPKGIYVVDGQKMIQR